MIKSTVKIDLKHMKVIKYHSNHNLSELVTEKIKNTTEPFTLTPNAIDYSKLTYLANEAQQGKYKVSC